MHTFPDYYLVQTAKFGPKTSYLVGPYTVDDVWELTADNDVTQTLPLNVILSNASTPLVVYKAEPAIGGATHQLYRDTSVDGLSVLVTLQGTEIIEMRLLRIRKVDPVPIVLYEHLQKLVTKFCFR